MRPVFRAATLAAALLFFGTNAFADDVPITEKARGHFEAGVNHLQDPDGARYEEAYREFKAAYQESPSWKILGNLGLTAMKLERDGEAIEAFEKYLAEGGAQLEQVEREQIERDLRTLKTGVAWVTIEVVPAGAALTDERVPVQGSAVKNHYTVSQGPLRLGLRSGHHRITAQAPGYEQQVWEFDAGGGSEQSKKFELVASTTAPTAGAPSAAPSAGADMGADAPTERPVPTGVYVGLAITGAAAIGATVTGVLALGKKSEYEDANDGSDPGAAESLKDSTQTLNLVTDVLLAASVVGAGVTAYLYFSRPEVTPGRESARLAITPLIGPNAGALSVSGRF